MLHEALKTHFGFERFRPPQEEIIGHILKSRDTLAIMPTGGGKSLCYQLPALMMPGVTLVISPLIALMKDQVDSLVERRLPAGFINSTQNLDEQRQVLQAMESGALKLVYVSPERFRARGFVQSLSRAQIAFVAVDEAHCLSQWGHDFRPDYLRIGHALEQLDSPPVAAFTATATPDVREDIRKHLKMRDPAEIVHGFARPNLTFSVEQVGSKIDKMKKLCQLVRTHRTGIIYCATRKSVEAVHEQLLEAGLRDAILYHGGMPDSERTRAQEEFLSGKVAVAVATNAFGMGIDRPDIRFVAHYEMPGSVEAFYQEGGRAGRDGQPAICQLLFNYSDKRVQEFFLDGANPTAELIREVYRTLQRSANDQQEVVLSIDDLAEKLDRKTNPMAVGTSLAVLSRQQVIERYDIPGRRIRGTRLIQPELQPGQLKIDTAALAEKRRRDEYRLDQVLKFCYANRCRQQWILEYFGEKNPEPCGHCDVCGASSNGRWLTESELTIVKKALSGVARMSERTSPREFRPRYGRQRIVLCLLGSKGKGVGDTTLANLSTYGLLKSEGAPFLNELFRRMEKYGLVEVTGQEMPVMGLTEKGVRVLFGEQPLWMDYPDRSNATTAGSAKKSRPAETFELKGAEEEEERAAEEPALDEDLLAQLKAKRGQLAAIRKVPPYTIFNNRVLEQLARLRPATREEALLLHGIGEGNARHLGPFLEIVRKK